MFFISEKMRCFYKFFIFISLIVLLISCKDNVPVHKNITGKAGEILFVVPENVWKGNAGIAIKDVFMSPQVSLPQEEPVFNVIHIPPKAFKGILMSSRNIVLVKISSSVDSLSVKYINDKWAYPQSIVSIEAPSTESFLDVFHQNSDKMVSIFLKAERNRLQINYKKQSDQELVNKIKEKFDISIVIPRGFKIGINKKDFMWVRYDTQDITQGLFIYSFPYKSDSTFTANYLLNKRDSLLKKYVDGPTKGSYMVTERRVSPFMNILRYKNNYSAEIRGLWRLKNDYMGGPYVSLSVLDASKNRVIVLDGFVYAPRFKKRDYLRQIEAIIYSLSLPDQAANDKIDSQLKMGN